MPGDLPVEPGGAGIRLTRPDERPLGCEALQLGLPLGARFVVEKARCLSAVGEVARVQLHRALTVLRVRPPGRELDLITLMRQVAADFHITAEVLGRLVDVRETLVDGLQRGLEFARDLLDGSIDLRLRRAALMQALDRRGDLLDGLRGRLGSRQVDRNVVVRHDESFVPRVNATRLRGRCQRRGPRSHNGIEGLRCGLGEGRNAGPRLRISGN